MAIPNMEQRMQQRGDSDSLFETPLFGGLLPDAVAIIAAALAAHAIALSRGLVWDDVIILDFMDRIGLWRIGAVDPFGFIRPGKMAVFSLLYELFGRSALGWQIAALMMFLITALLVWQFACQILPPRAALIAALIYAVHPLHIEGTFWMASINGLLMTGLAVGYLLVMSRDDGKGRFPALASATLLYALAIGMKEEAALAPLIALALLWLRHRAIPMRVWLAIGAQLAILAGLLGVKSVLSVDVERATQTSEAGLLMTLTSPRTIAWHFAYFFWPFRWAFFTDRFPSTPMYAIQTVAAFLAAAALALHIWKRNLQPWSFCLVFAVIGILPASNLIPMNNMQLGVRYLAFSGIGLAMLAGLGIHRALQASAFARASTNDPGLAQNAGALAPGARFGRLAGVDSSVAAAGLGIWLTGAVFFSWQQHSAWSDDMRLFETMTQKGNFSLSRIYLARVQYEAGDYQNALANTTQCIQEFSLEEVDPPTLAYVMRGMSQRRLGMLDEAVDSFETAIEISEEYGEPEASFCLGEIYDTLYSQSSDPRHLDLAMEHYRGALSPYATNGENAYVNYGRLLAIEGQLEDAIKVWSRGLDFFPVSDNLRKNIDIARRALEKPEPEPESSIANPSDAARDES